MKIKFKDRFNRKFLDKYKFLMNKIGYDQLGKLSGGNRDNLPASFWLDGDIFWCNTKMQYHCITGPSISRVNGEINFAIDAVEMTKMEWLLAIE